MARQYPKQESGHEVQIDLAQAQTDKVREAVHQHLSFLAQQAERLARCKQSCSSKHFLNSRHTYDANHRVRCGQLHIRRPDRKQLRLGLLKQAVVSDHLHAVGPRRLALFAPQLHQAQSLGPSDRQPTRMHHLFVGNRTWSRKCKLESLARHGLHKTSLLLSRMLLIQPR